MNKKKIIFPILSLLILIGCTTANKVKPDSPENLAILASLAINNQDFELLKSYFTEPKKETINKNYFSNLIDIKAPGTEFKTYSYIRMNGQMFLLEIILDHESKTYKIQEIIKIPKEYEELFNSPENR